MSTAVINPPNYIDIEFSKLNDLTTRLRTAGAKITVKKIGTLYRIILLKQPIVASVEQVLNYLADSKQNQTNTEPQTTETFVPPVLEKQVVITNDVPNESQIKAVSLDELSLEQLKKLASIHKVSGRSKMNACQLREKLASNSRAVILALR